MNNNLTNLFLDLVKIDSPTGHESLIAKYLIAFFSERRIRVCKDSFGNVIAKMGGYGEPIFLSAHMDTVEPGKNIKPVVKDGLIKSSGDTILGADNKEALASILYAIDHLLENNISHRSLELVFTVNEESENLGAVNLDYNKIKSRGGFIFDAAKPIGTIITASPYYLRFDITILGKSAHASRPEMANNSILVFTDAMRNINLGKIDEKTIVNIGSISAGHVRNTIPGEMKLMGEVRSFEQGVVEEVSKNILIEFKKSAKKFGSKIKSDILLENPGYEYDEDEPIVRYAQKILMENKINVIFEKYQGCSDANIFINENLRVLNLGNGSRNAHTVNEEISIKDLEKLSNLILSLTTS